MTSPTRPPPGRARLAALDLDGTLIDQDQSFRPAVAAAVAAALDAGVTVILATGRADPSARRFHEALGLRGPMISYQGAVVAGPDGERWHATSVPAQAVTAATAFADDRGDELTCYHDDRVYYRRELQDAHFYKAWFGLPRVRISDWSGVPGASTKLLMIGGNPQACDSISAAWSARFAGEMDIVRSHPLFVEAVAHGVSKGRALAQLAERMGLDSSDVLCVGDNENDISMLEWAGVGVAIGGAPPHVEAAANTVAPPLAEDGAAWALLRYALGRDV